MIFLSFFQSELITSKGYPVEEHIVQTDDGYILSLIRIPRGIDTDSQYSNKGSVLLIHGDLSDAVQWVLDFPNQSLGNRPFIITIIY